MLLTDGATYWLSLASAIVAAIVGALVLCRGLRGYVRTGEWGAVFGVTIPLSIAWLLFHFGAILYLIPPIRHQARIYGEAAPDVTALIAVLVLAGFLLYEVSFRAVAKLAIRVPYGRVVGLKSRQTGAALISLAVLIPVDWYGRVTSIMSGTYLTWVRASFREAHIEATTDPIQLLLMTTGYGIIGLLCYLYWNSAHKRHRFLISVLLAIQSALLLMRGSRRDVFFILVIVSVAYIMAHERVRFTVKQALIGVLLLGGLFALMAGIASARQDIRRQAASGTLEPETLMVRYLEEVPVRMASPSSHAFLASDLVVRVTSYSNLVSVIWEEQLEQRAQPAGVNALAVTFKRTIPRFLYFNKPQSSPNEALWRLSHGVVPAHDDPPSSPVGGSIVYLGALGILLLFPMGGMIVGCYWAILRPLETLGSYVMLGSIPQFMLIGSDVAAYLANLRNVALMVGMVIIALLITGLRRKGIGRGHREPQLRTW